MGYARVSTEEQSLDLQRTAIIAAGVNPDRDLFCDKNSATYLQRPWFKLMLKQIQAGDTLIVYSVSRLFRDTEKLLAFFKMMKAKGVKIKSLTETLDLETSQGRMVATMQAAVDQYEREKIGDRTRDGMAERVRQGVQMGRKPKVSPAKAVTMKDMRKRGVKVPVIAKKFGVSTAAVYLHTTPKRKAA